MTTTTATTGDAAFGDDADDGRDGTELSLILAAFLEVPFGQVPDQANQRERGDSSQQRQRKCIERAEHATQGPVRGALFLAMTRRWRA